MDKKTSRLPVGERALATGALLGAIAASSCCVLPLLFVSVGISGAWIGSLTKLAAYQPIFFALSAGCIAAGFWSVYTRRPLACDGPECGSVASRRATKIALWIGLVVLGVAASAEWWVKLLT